MTASTLTGLEPAPKYYQWGVAAVCFLAFCTNLGAATIVFSKYLVLLMALIVFINERRAGAPWWPGAGNLKSQSPLLWLLLAYGWMIASLAWTSAPINDALSVLGHKHTRMLWIIFCAYLLRSHSDVLKAVASLTAGQLLVLFFSYLLWLGVPVPFTVNDYPPEFGVVFTSTLEQPVMSTLLLSALWLFYPHFSAKLPRWVLVVFIISLLFNGFFIMTGRTGYLVLLAAIALCLWWLLPRRWRILVVVAPVFCVLAAWQLSPQFKARVAQVSTDVSGYLENKDTTTSQGIRLDMWLSAGKMWLDHPIAGVGIGSFTERYAEYGGNLTSPHSTPHQQYLQWASELGIIGLGLFLAFFLHLARTSFTLPQPTRRYTQLTLLIVALTALANQPFNGIGTGEMFAVMFALVIVWLRLPPAPDE